MPVILFRTVYRGSGEAWTGWRLLGTAAACRMLVSPPESHVFIRWELECGLPTGVQVEAVARVKPFAIFFWIGLVTSIMHFRMVFLPACLFGRGETILNRLSVRRRPRRRKAYKRAFGSDDITYPRTWPASAPRPNEDTR